MQITHLRGFDIPLELHAGVMRVLAVGAGHEIVHDGDFVVGVYLHVQFHRSDEAAGDVGFGNDQGFVGGVEPFTADQVLEFNGVELAVAPHQTRHQPVFVFHDDGFDDLPGRDFEEFRHIVHRFFPGRTNLL